MTRRAHQGSVGAFARASFHWELASLCACVHANTSVSHSAGRKERGPCRAADQSHPRHSRSAVTSSQAPRRETCPSFLANAPSAQSSASWHAATPSVSL